MNGSSSISQPSNNNEQLIGKFHVEKLPNNIVAAHDEHPNTTVQQTAPVSTVDETNSGSRFQMIRVDRNFGRGRWKVNDYEPPENTTTSVNAPVNAAENELVNSSNLATFPTMPITAPVSITTTTIPTNMTPMLPADLNTTSQATLAATAASAAAAAATAFQQQQQRLAMSNSAGVVTTANVPNPAASLLHPYPTTAMPNIPPPNQSYLVPNHFGYYTFLPPPYGPYPPQWAAMAAANPYLAAAAMPPPPPQQQQTASQLPPTAHSEPLRLPDQVPEVNNENNVISSNPFATSTEQLQNSQLAGSSFIYAPHHPSNYLPQIPSTTGSSYATIPSYHGVPPQPTIVPPPPTAPHTQSTVTTSLEIQQPTSTQTHTGPSQYQVPVTTSPKHEAAVVKPSVQQSTTAPPTKATAATAQINPTKPTATIPNGTFIDTSRATAPNSTQITDILSSSPGMFNSQQNQPSLLSPINVQGTNPNASANSALNKAANAAYNDIWPYANTGSPLNLTHTAAQTAAVTAVAAMGLLNNENGKNTEIANEILKELTTPTKQNNTTDIDNKISAAMDLVKMHLLSAVREEVTELRQQIRTLHEKISAVEHENAFLRQHVPSETLSQYTPLFVGSTASNDGINPMSSAFTSAPNIPTLPPSSSTVSSQSVPTTTASTVPTSLSTAVPSLASVPSSLTTNPQLPTVIPSSVNLPAN